MQEDNNDEGIRVIHEEWPVWGFWVCMGFIIIAMFIVAFMGPWERNVDPDISAPEMDRYIPTYTEMIERICAHDPNNAMIWSSVIHFAEQTGRTDTMSSSSDPDIIAYKGSGLTTAEVPYNFVIVIRWDNGWKIDSYNLERVEALE